MQKKSWNGTRMEQGKPCHKWLRTCIILPLETLQYQPREAKRCSGWQQVLGFDSLASWGVNVLPEPVWISSQHMQLGWLAWVWIQAWVGDAALFGGLPCFSVCDTKKSLGAALNHTVVGATQGSFSYSSNLCYLVNCCLICMARVTFLTQVVMTKVILHKFISTSWYSSLTFKAI